MINIINSSQLIPALQIINKQKTSLDLFHYSIFNQTFIQTNITNLPLTFSLCQFNLSDFQILITNISKGQFLLFFFLFKRQSMKTLLLIGPCLSNQYRCLVSNEDQWCIDESLHCDGYYSCPQGIDELSCPSKVNSTNNLFRKIDFSFRNYVEIDIAEDATSDTWWNSDKYYCYWSFTNHLIS